jgi:small subunit ribosomal protein S9
MSGQYYEGIGRRKESIARVRLAKGNGTIVVNTKPLAEFFPRIGDIDEVISPLSAIGEDRNQYDITVVVKGGGVTGQTDAVKLGLARALVLMNPDLRHTLREAGLLTRDPRAKERKKPGLKRARKAPTYTKR